MAQGSLKAATMMDGPFEMGLWISADPPKTSLNYRSIFRLFIHSRLPVEGKYV